jgi:hypothetical protein
MTDSIIGRLDPHRHIEAVDDAARLLEFLLSRFIATISYDDEAAAEDETTWRFSTGHPWRHAKGPDPETAIRNAMAEDRTGAYGLRKMRAAIKQEAVKDRIPGLAAAMRRMEQQQRDGATGPGNSSVTNQI